MSVRGAESRLAAATEAVARWSGSAWAPAAAAAVIAALLVVGALGDFSTGWAYAVHTAGAFISVFMLFVVQHTTNRESHAILVKLDELIHSSARAHNELIDVEDEQISEQEQLHNELHHDH
ncbi:low affinity iron permease family protein [Rhodococcus sp. NPDC003322]